MPNKEKFPKIEDYYSVIFHELTHSTGHASRLARKSIQGNEWTTFGTPNYAKEELVAEMGAAFVCGHLGIVDRTIDNSASYINNWLTALKNDPKLIVTAAGAAQKAADFILGIHHESTVE